MGDFKKIVNIGKDTEEKILQAGIDTFEKMTALGTEQVFIRLQTIDPGACLSLLYGIDGAIEGTKWNKLSPERKHQLQVFFKQVKK
jgi:DNA transformation protein